MLNFYLKEAYDYKLITRNKFISYSNHLLEIHNMILSWFNYETN